MEISFRNFVGCFWRNLVHFVKANLLFWLFCLPVVTIPASIASLYNVCTDAAMGKSCAVWRTYISTIKEKFGRSFAVGLIYAFVFGFSGIALWFYRELRTGSAAAIIPEGIALAVAFVAFTAFPYSFVMLGETDLQVKEILKNSLIILTLEPKTTVVSAVICFFWTYLQVSLFMNLYALILVIGATLVVYAGAYFAIYGLLRHVITNNTDIISGEDEK